MQCWNVGGAKSLKIQSYLDSLRECDDASIVLIQEYPKGTPGWSKTQEHGAFSVVTYQPQHGYRGTGIAFKNAKWTLLKKKATEHGTWYLLQHVRAAKKTWFGSGYLSTGINKDARTSEVQSLLDGLPPTAEMAILGADLNTRLDWEDDGNVKYVSSSAGKTQAMIDHFGTRRLQGISQVNVHTPTYWTRKTPSSSSQIDGFFTNALGRCSEVRVQEGSRKIIGSDHEVIEVDIRLQFAERPRKRSGCPRVMRQDITIQVNEVAFLDQKEIEKLAVK